MSSVAVSLRIKKRENIRTGETTHVGFFTSHFSFSAIFLPPPNSSPLSLKMIADLSMESRETLVVKTTYHVCCCKTSVFFVEIVGPLPLSVSELDTLASSDGTTG